MQIKCISGNYCNNCLKGGLFPDHVNGNLAWGCPSEGQNLSVIPYDVGRGSGDCCFKYVSYQLYKTANELYRWNWAFKE